MAVEGMVETIWREHWQVRILTHLLSSKTLIIATNTTREIVSVDFGDMLGSN